MLSQNSKQKVFTHVNTYQRKIVDRVTYPNGNRFYSIDGEAYPSITTLLSLLSKDGIKKWEHRIGKDNADRIKGALARRGSTLHEVIEKYLNNDPTYLDGCNISIKILFKQIKMFLDRIDNIIFQEAPLYSKALRVAGTTDVIGDYDKELAIIDFKNSRKTKERQYINGYFHQVAFYGLCFAEMYGIAPKKLVVIVTDADGGSEIFVESFEKHLRNSFIKIKELRSTYEQLEKQQ